MNNKLIIYLAQCTIAILSLLCCACNEEDFAPANNFQFTLDATTDYSGAESRAVFNDADEIDIKKYGVLIYDGTTADAKLIHCEEVTTLPLTVNLRKTSNVNTYRAILIANQDFNHDSFANAKIVDVSTISDLNNAFFGVSPHYSIPGNTDGTMDPDGPAYAGAAKNFTWSGYKDFGPNDNSIVVHLNPNMAKMKITVYNNTASSGTSKDLHIINLQIKNVRNKILFAQNALSDMGLYEEPSGLGVTSYNIEKLELAPGEYKTREYYIPHNEIPTDGKTRPDGPANATYIEVDGVRHKDYVNIAYKLYPGTKIKENHYEGNYHILADHKYNVTININKTGVTYSANNEVVPSKDNGVEVQNVVLPTGTNCYMIHPKFTKTANANGTVFELPIDRVNEYWGAGKIDKDTEWRMYVIWQDIPSRSIYFTNKEGTTKTDYYQGKGNNPAYFKFDSKYKNLSPTTTTADQLKTMYGNILVGLTTDAHNGTNGDKYNCLWSWHLWVTDYNPDAAPTPSQASSYNNTSVNSLYTQSSANSLTADYPIDLQGYYFNGNSTYMPYGNVQHFHHNRTEYWDDNTTSDNVWGGIYNDKWIMDRHLGSKAPVNIDLVDPTDGLGLYYQYGRKDPFPYKNTYDITGTARSTTKWTNSNGPVAISEGVKHPNNFYMSATNTLSSWTNGNTSNKWYSPKALAQTGEKTLFDPCPAGWCLPVYDVFDFAKLSQGDKLYGNATTSDTNFALANNCVIYFNCNSSGAWGDINRHVALLTSVKKIGSKYYKLDAVIAMQREIDQTGALLQFDKTDDNVGYAGCLWTLDGYVGFHGYLKSWLNNGEADSRPGSGLYCKKRQGTINSFKDGTERAPSRGHVVRCIQDPYN